MAPLLDFRSRLQATNLYTQTSEDAERKMSQETSDVGPGPMSASGSAQHQVTTHASHWTTLSLNARDDMTTVYPVTNTTDLSEAVREAVNKRMHQAPILTITTSEAISDSDAEPCEPQHNHHPLISGKIRTADSMVVRTLTWPHNLVYTVVGRAPSMRR